MESHGKLEWKYYVVFVWTVSSAASVIIVVVFSSFAPFFFFFFFAPFLSLIYFNYVILFTFSLLKGF